MGHTDNTKRSVTPQSLVYPSPSPPANRKPSGGSSTSVRTEGTSTSSRSLEGGALQILVSWGIALAQPARTRVTQGPCERCICSQSSCYHRGRRQVDSTTVGPGAKESRQPLPEAQEECCLADTCRWGLPLVTQFWHLILTKHRMKIFCPLQPGHCTTASGQSERRGTTGVMCKAKGLQDLAQLSRLPKPAHQAILALCPPGTDSADQAKGSLSQ